MIASKTMSRSSRIAARSIQDRASSSFGRSRKPRTSIGESRAREADRIARRITAMIAGKEQLSPESRVQSPEPGPDSGLGTWDSGLGLRPVQPRDVVLLFRAMTNVSIYENALRDQGIDYYLVGGRAFFAQQEIYDLLNLLRTLENPQDAVSLAGTLRSPFCCLSDEALFLLAVIRRLWPACTMPTIRAACPTKQRQVADRARRSLRPLARLEGLRCRSRSCSARSSPIQAMTRRRSSSSSATASWPTCGSCWTWPGTFDRSGLFGLAEFIARLGDLVRTQPREEQAATQPENADVVRLMTIHQAKGLEFPVVFLPDLAARRRRAHHRVAVWDKSLGCVANRRPTKRSRLSPISAGNYGRRPRKLRTGTRTCAPFTSPAREPRITWYCPRRCRAP